MNRFNRIFSVPDRWAAWMVALIALLPFAACRSAFSELWWFGDDWDLLDQIDRHGFWPWTLQAFAENFVPLFKLLWGGLVFASDGNYMWMITALWLTHAATAFAYVRVLRAAGFGWIATSLSAAVFALTSDHIETLAWSVQGSAILATGFFLWGSHWLLMRQPQSGPWQWKPQVVLALLTAASALCFSRGVLTGACFAAVCLAGQWDGATPASRIRTAITCLAPAVGVAIVIFFSARGNHQSLRPDAFEQALTFAAWYWAVAPWHRLLEMDSWGPKTSALLGVIKLLLVAGAYWNATRRQRRLLDLLLLFDLGNAALLGIGRFHTGLEATNSSRYHYAAALSSLPFAGICFESALTRIPFVTWRGALAAIVVAIVSMVVSRDWTSSAQAFAEGRGRNTRHLLLFDPNPPASGAVPGIAFMSTARAKELVSRFGLH